jgi:hypothetical protein
MSVLSCIINLKITKSNEYNFQSENLRAAPWLAISGAFGFVVGS